MPSDPRALCLIMGGLNIEPGTVIADRYRVERCLGKGGMGEVWAGRSSDGRDVAIKILLDSTAGSGEVVARFKREAQVLARVQSDYVARVLGFVSDPRPASCS